MIGFRERRSPAGPVGAQHWLGRRFRSGTELPVPGLQPGSPAEGCTTPGLMGCRLLWTETRVRDAALSTPTSCPARVCARAGSRREMAEGTGRWIGADGMRRERARLSERRLEGGCLGIPGQDKDAQLWEGSEPPRAISAPNQGALRPRAA